MGGSQYRQRARSRETEAAVAGWYADHGWPHASPVGPFRNGPDIIGMEGLAVEVKARRDFNMLQWLKQHRDGHLTPALSYVVIRPDGYGPAHVAAWPVVMRLDEHTALLRAAGHGQ